ncbi:MAG: HAMP domain-containing histidine kinase [Gammaproteobacteria bacterium]|nr:HAMP domain-containing histidine kinase [Gammaproteobacteria bacterium]MBL6998912.1 HAMP domain-containing histidine kinase [Gammaproteobacteria bacterium]
MIRLSCYNQTIPVVFALKHSTNTLNPAQFKLVRYFSFASITMFVLVALAFSYFITQQSIFFNEVQNQQIQKINSLQASFAQQQQDVSRRDLLAIHESGNVNLTRLFANSLWTEYMAPFVREAAKISSDHCDAKNGSGQKDGLNQYSDNSECFIEVGQRILQIPSFGEINKKVFESMQKSTVFKIKVFDLRGVTVYSSQHSQIGESKMDNKGWQSAVAGIPASELTHRDTFSAFEGVVEDRDVISSYLPVYQPGSDELVGVFEVYSDVTPFLRQIKLTADKMDAIARNNLNQVEIEALSNQARVETSSGLMLMIIFILLLVLFLSLFFIVLRADRILAVQAEEREKAQTQLAQAEKMASLGQMVAGVAHQLNTPIAFSHSNISLIKSSMRAYDPVRKIYMRLADYFSQHDDDQVAIRLQGNRKKMISQASILPEISTVEGMLDDTLNGLEQMRELVDNLQAFTRLDRAKTSLFNINEGLKNVVYIARSVIPTGIHVVESYAELPLVRCNPSQLNQIFLNLINNSAQALSGKGEILISSQLSDDFVVIRVQDDGPGINAEDLPYIFDMYFTTKPVGEGTGMGLGIAQTIAQEHGGDITVESSPGKGTVFSVKLPIDQRSGIR